MDVEQVRGQRGIRKLKHRRRKTYRRKKMRAKRLDLHSRFQAINTEKEEMIVKKFAAYYGFVSAGSG